MVERRAGLSRSSSIRKRESSLPVVLVGLLLLLLLLLVVVLPRGLAGLLETAIATAAIWSQR